MLKTLYSSIPTLKGGHEFISVTSDKMGSNLINKNPFSLQVPLNNVNEKNDNTGHVLNLLQDYKKQLEYIKKEKILDMEKLKSEYIKLIEFNLKRDLRISQVKEFPPEVQPQKYKKFLYYVLMILGTINDAARNYMFGCALISLIPSLSNPLRIMLSIFYIFFEAILFYGFEVALLKDALGISNKNTNFSCYINTNIEQVRMVTHINQLLVNIQVFDMEDKLYQDYQTVVTTLNADLNTKFQSLQSYEEPLFKKILKMVALGFGMITNIASSYFMFNTVLTVWAATLVGTPLGWGIIILAILVELGFYYAMGVTSILRLLNSDQNNFNVLKNELSIFEQDYLLFFSKRIKKQEVNLSHRIVHDMATQTEPSMN